MIWSIFFAIAIVTCWSLPIHLKLTKWWIGSAIILHIMFFIWMFNTSLRFILIPVVGAFVYLLFKKIFK